MLVCVFLQFCTRDRRCSAHPAFPAPSILREAKRSWQNSGKSRREIADSCEFGIENLDATAVRSLSHKGRGDNRTYAQDASTQLATLTAPSHWRTQTTTRAGCFRRGSGCG